MGNLPAIDSVVIDVAEVIVEPINTEPTVDDLMEEVKAASAELATLSNEVGREEAGTGLVAVESAPEIKLRMAHNRAAIVKQKAKLAKASAALEARVKADLEAANAILKPLMEQVERLEEGIWTVNLYLGRDEHMVRLLEGDPAPASEPIAVRQMVLAMDEECRVAAEKGGIDANDIDSFDDWLLADPAHIQQVIPEQRAVVVLVPTRQRRDYGSMAANMAMAEENAKSYWLIRNGENLVRMTTDLEVGKHVIPSQDEFTRFFRTKRYDHKLQEDVWTDLEPGSREWLKAEKAADKHKRHYMRVALVLQGLVDRTAVFHPLPAETVSFLQPESYDEGHVRIITDAELALGTGLMPYKKWLAKLNRELRPGMRIIGAFHGSLFRGARWADEEYDERRISPNRASSPQSNQIHYIDGFSKDGGFTFKYKRTDKKEEKYWEPNPDRPGWGWDRWREVEYKTRATCRVYSYDDFIIPIDLVTVEELQAYIDARTERKDYISLIPLMKTAIEVKQAEFEEEAPVRQLLTGIIMRDHDAPLDEIEEALPELINWWKLGNRWHRPLVSDDSEEFAKALRMISSEFAARRTANAEGSAQADVEGRVVEKLVQDHTDVVAVFRKRDGKFMVFTAANEKNVFIHRHIAGLRTESKLDREWILPGTAWRKWRNVYSTERWEEWDLGATLKDNLTQPEIDNIVERCLELHPEYGVKLAVCHYNYYGAKGDFEVHARGEQIASFPPDDRLLTGRWTDVQTMSFKVGWERKDGKVELITDTWGYGRSEEKWGDTFNGRSGVPWLHDTTYWSLLWEQVGAVDAIQAERADYLAARERAKPLRALVDQVMRSAKAAWVASEEAIAYERFIEDYADPELWEDHRKTLKLKQSPFYFHQNPMVDLAKLVVEQGKLEPSMSVAEMVAAVDFAHADELEDVLDLVIEVDLDEDDEDEWDDEDWEDDDVIDE